MKKVHDFKTKDVDFSGYLLNFRKSIFMPENLNVNYGDFIRLIEFTGLADILTGRTLMFEILYINKTPGLIGIGNLWLIDLKKVEAA
jgi:hypothetical protein